MKKKVYLIGDYLQYELDEANAVFSRREQELSDLGYEVINPQNFLKPGMPLIEVLAKSIPLLLNSDCVSYIELEYPQYKYISPRTMLEEFIVNSLRYTSSQIKTLNNPLSHYKSEGLSIQDAITECTRDYYSHLYRLGNFWHSKDQGEPYSPLVKYCIDKGYLPECTNANYEVYYYPNEEPFDDNIVEVYIENIPEYLDRPSNELRDTMLQVIPSEYLKYGDILQFKEYVFIPDYLPDYYYGYGDPRNDDEMIYSLKNPEYSLSYEDESNVNRPEVPMCDSDVDYRALIREHLFLLLSCTCVREHPFNQVISFTNISDIENNIYLLDKSALPTLEEYLSDPAHHNRDDSDIKDFSLFGEAADYIDEWRETDPRLSPSYSIIDSIVSFIIEKLDIL